MEDLLRHLRNLNYPKLQEVQDNFGQVLEGSGLRLRLLEWLLLEYDAQLCEWVSKKHSGSGEVNRTLRLCTLCHYLGLIRQNDVKQLEGKSEEDKLRLFKRLLEMINLKNDGECVADRMKRDLQLISFVSENQKSIFSNTVDLFPKNLIVSLNLKRSDKEE